MTTGVRTVNGPEELRALVGQHIGWSEPHQITQVQVNTFADATGDHQWIHVDPHRAKDGPFGGTIAHGYLSLSLLARFLPEVLNVQGFSMGINYGAEKVRFPSPVPVGSNVQGGFAVAAVDEHDGGVQITLTGAIQVVDAPKPSCVAEVVYRYYV